MNKPQETSTFHYVNPNPKNKRTGDCVVRAICLATELPYVEVLNGLFEVCLKTGYMINSKECYSKYLAKLGWEKQSQPRKLDNTKYTGNEFCKERAGKNRKYIAHIGGHHIVAIIDRKVNDIWNSTGGCIGNYWVKYDD